jgi:hypothetical protein
VTPLVTVPLDQPIAWDVPQLGVVGSHDDRQVPIASLTKMMTALVTLNALPISVNETGPCITTTETDAATYAADAASDQSSISVAAGEHLCERDLLRGLLVHSASNYAAMLSAMVTGASGADALALMVSRMNEMAHSMGLVGTHYADVAGFNDGSVSTATDQVRLAAALMTYPFVRATVDLTSINDPYAGEQASFTPLVGLDGVDGVKSGRTAAAGGCDAMAVAYRTPLGTDQSYVVVLDARGGDLLTPAGAEALNAEQSIVHHWNSRYIPRGTVVSHISDGHGRSVSLRTTRGTWLEWWGLSATWQVRLRPDTSVSRGSIVGTLVAPDDASGSVELVATASIPKTTLLDRLR